MDPSALLDDYVFLDPHNWVAGSLGDEERVSVVQREICFIVRKKIAWSSVSHNSNSSASFVHNSIQRRAF